VRVALLGATRGIGRAVARRLAARGDAVFLLGRDEEQLARSASDLALRGATGTVGHAPCDLLRPETFAPALDAATTALGGLDTVVVTAAELAPQERLDEDAALRQRILTIDFLNTVQFCEEARRRLLAAGGGTLCVFSSIAGDRARAPVALYGAAKAGLTHYLTGLDHRFRRRGLVTVLVKPGFVRTSMTAGMKEPPFAGEADDVAARVVRAIDRGSPIVHAPAIWRLVMLVVRALPRWVMRRARF